MTALKTTGGVLGILGAVSLVLVQFLPWGGVEAGGFGGSVEATAYTWKMEGSFSGFGFDGSEKESWYSEDVEDDDNSSEVARIRIAIPLLMAGLALGALGGILALAARGGAAAVVLLVAGLVAAAGTVLFAMAVDGLFDSDQDWGASFYLAIASCVLLLAGGVLGLLGGDRGQAA